MKITIFGLGALGSNLLIQLAKQFPDVQFIGVDFDRVEERNVRTQAYFLEHVGMLKVDAMRVLLARYLRKPRYTPLNQKITHLKSVELQYHINDSLWIDCFDNTVSRKILAEQSSDILHIGFSPHYTAECIWNEQYTVPEDVDATAPDICSTVDATAFIHLVVNTSVLNISDWLQNQQKKNFIVTNKHRIQWL